MNAEDNISLNNIPWLDTSVITGRQEKQTFDIVDLADIVGSGESVGGVITRFVGAGTSQEAPQLQRIVARCGCEFYFVSFSSELDPVAEEMAPRVVVSGGVVFDVVHCQGLSFFIKPPPHNN